MKGKGEARSTPRLMFWKGDEKDRGLGKRKPLRNVIPFVVRENE